MGNWLRRAAAPIVQTARRVGFFGAERGRPGPRPSPAELVEAMAADSLRRLSADCVESGFAEDSSVKAAYALSGSGAAPELLSWYAQQTFIGYQSAAILAQHWLVSKACSLPARDAVRVGYEIAAEDGELPDDIAKRLQRADKRHKIDAQMVEFVTAGRVFGIRIAFAVFDLDNADEFYENPFNPDGIPRGSYRGMTQVDPQWCSPELDHRSAADPAGRHFYEPTWWVIGGKRYHRTHLIIFRNGHVPDILKPVYRYGGVPVPQAIMERVYGAERTATESLQLVVTKRLNTLGVDGESAVANPEGLRSALEEFTQLRNNYGVRVYDKESEEVSQLDTSLSELSDVIMTQYQLVAAAAEVPATKLLGTTPKGFNPTGEYDESSYHEGLESIQTHDLAPFLARHHLSVMRSEFEPAQRVAVVVVWAPLDSPTSAEAAATQKTLADRDAVLASIGAIDGMDVRARLARDEESGYYGVETADPGDDGGEGP